jgi:hypothetical protein
MDSWKKSFLDKLNRAQSHWAGMFDEALDASIEPVFEDLSAFLEDNGFGLSRPLQESGRRSYKFALAEDAYALLIFESRAVGEFELTRELFVLGSDPQISRGTERVLQVDDEWARREIQSLLDRFVELLAREESAVVEELPVG